MALGGAMLTYVLVMLYLFTTPISLDAQQHALLCKDCHHSSRVSRMTQYFRESGSPTPEALAEAVLSTKSPRLLAAVSVAGEKNTPYWVRRGGYKKRHAGAWQVNQRIHGRVSRRPTEQAKQAERILEDLLKESKGDVVKALNHFGGDTTRRMYALNVLDELKEVPR
jgi:hypothetical protein